MNVGIPGALYRIGSGRGCSDGGKCVVQHLDQFFAVVRVRLSRVELGHFENRLSEIRDLGYPVLLGPSRKSFIGYTLDLPPDDRLAGTGATVAVGITRGADIIRVHDVPEMIRVCRMTDAIVR